MVTNVVQPWARGPRRGFLFVCGLGTAFGAVLAPICLLLPSLLTGTLWGQPLGSLLIGLFIVGLTTVIGLVAGLVGSAIAMGLVVLLRQRNSRAGAAVLLLAGFATSYAIGASLAYLLGAPESDALASSAVPAVLGAVALTTSWVAWPHRGGAAYGTAAGSVDSFF